jgi:transposase-like protein
VGRYSNEFRRACVDDISTLSRELDIDRRLLYRWRDQLDPPDKSEWPPPQNTRESTLRKEVSQLKRVLAEKTLELDFFKGALQPSIPYLCGIQLTHYKRGNEIDNQTRGARVQRSVEICQRFHRSSIPKYACGNQASAIERDVYHWTEPFARFLGRRAGSP